MSTDMPDGIRWFDSKPIVVVSLIVFFPLGLYGLWKNTGFSARTKWIVTGTFGILLCASALVEEANHKKADKAADAASPPAIAKTSPQRSTTNTQPGTNDMTALDRMEIAFEGGHRKHKIKSRLEEAMRLYQLPVTEENRSRAGSVLVALRKRSGNQEMDILSYMIRSHVSGVQLSFSEAAAFSDAFLAAGDR